MEKSEILRYVAEQGYKPFSTEAIVAIQAIEWVLSNILKDAQGDNLPEIDKEVIALIYLTFEGIPHYQVVFAHRPNPEGYDGKSVTTEKVEHCTPKTYDKGGWNIPNIKYWLDLDIPKK